MKARSDVTETISYGHNAYVEEGVVAIPRFGENLSKRVSHYVTGIVSKSENRDRYGEDS
jgi:hypothetical protein